MVSDLNQTKLLVEQAMKKYNRSVVISNWLIGLALTASITTSAVVLIAMMSN